MNRQFSFFLSHWKSKKDRKPLLLRGARQVGKTYGVRAFGEKFSHFLEFNFEKEPQLKKIFENDLNPKRILAELGLFKKMKIIPGENTLLFLDEIQECPQAILALRYFYEELTELRVIAAGSLLEFSLDQVGVPVGRVEFLYVYPLSFLEFLEATGNALLIPVILQASPSSPPSEVISEHIWRLWREYLAVGGMPKVVQRWIEDQDLLACQHLQKTLLENYEQDFEKYGRARDLKNFDLVFQSIPRLLGKKIILQQISAEARSTPLKEVLLLLEKAGVLHRVCHSSGNGVPIASEKNPDKFKAIFLDVALAQALLKEDIRQWILDPESMFVNKGALIESVIGQELLAYSDPQFQSHLYYWHRENKSAVSEVDYLIELGNTILPVEVKSGPSQKLKSTYQFLNDRPQTPYALLFYHGHFAQKPAAQLPGKLIHQYPLYAVSAALGVKYQMGE